MARFSMINPRMLNRFYAVLILVVSLWAAALPVRAETADSAPTPQKPAVWGSPIRLFQKFVSRADGNRCPMYPSCSHYGAQAFAEHGMLKGWILTCDRLLRCGRDETRRAAPVRVDGVSHAYDSLAANTFWWDKQ